MEINRQGIVVCCKQIHAGERMMAVNSVVPEEWRAPGKIGLPLHELRIRDAARAHSRSSPDDEDILGHALANDTKIPMQWSKNIILPWCILE